MKKLSLLLVVFVLIGTLTVSFSGCSQLTALLDGLGNAVESESDVVEKGEQTGDGYVADNLPEYDFDGEKVIILAPTWRNTPDYILQKTFKGGDIVSEAMVKAYYTVAERFNMEIELLLLGDQKVTQSKVETEAISGEKMYDIVYNHDLRTVANAINGCFLDIKTMENVNLDNPWWTASSKKFQVADKLYFTSSYLGIWAPYMNFGLYYNKVMAEENGITIPYDDIKAGEWYIDDLIQLTKNMKYDIDGDGLITPENDNYGFVTGYHGNVAAQTNLLGTFIEQTSNGGNKINVNVSKASSYMDKMSELYSNGLGNYEGVESNNISVFKGGRSLFIYTETRILVENLNDIKFAWGVLPFPKYDDSQEEYSSAGYDLFWGVNKNMYDRTEIISTAIEALSCQNYNKVIPTIWEKVFGNRLADMSIDYQMVAIVRDTTFVNPDYVYSDQIMGMSNLLNLWDTSDESGVASYITANAAPAQVSLKLFAEKIAALP